MPVWVMASFPVCSHAGVNKYLLSTYCIVGPHHRGGGHPCCPWAASCSVPATECLLDGRHGCGSWRTSVSSCVHPACRSAACTQTHLGGALCSERCSLTGSWPGPSQLTTAFLRGLSCLEFAPFVQFLADQCGLELQAATTCCLDLSVLTAALCLQQCPFFSPNP